MRFWMFRVIWYWRDKWLLCHVTFARSNIIKFWTSSDLFWGEGWVSTNKHFLQYSAASITQTGSYCFGRGHISWPHWRKFLAIIKKNTLFMDSRANLGPCRCYPSAAIFDLSAQIKNSTPGFMATGSATCFHRPLVFRKINLFERCDKNFLVSAKLKNSILIWLWYLLRCRTLTDESGVFSTQ